MPDDVVPARSVKETLALLCAAPAEADGEGEFLVEHGLQCAAILRDERPDDVELQVAGLLHDIGHQLAPGHPELHGVAGARFLRGLFGDRVADLVELHVDAKRYLVAVEPEYRWSLSDESAATLVAQGEALDDEAVEAFARHPLAADAITLRRADEGAKVPGLEVPGLATWIPVLERLAEVHGAAKASPA
jgi:predicted HD phosphohydrolase